MINKTYEKYLLGDFLRIFLKVSLVFFSLIILLNILEEINFFKDENENTILVPTILTFLNSPSLLFNIFPFIFFITTQFFFIKIIDNQEIQILKYYGITNLNIIKLLTLISFLLSLILVVFFYNFSAKLKFKYLDIKNSYSNDDKYLATITENGMWIKDEINNEYRIINASKIENKYLLNVEILKFDKNFDLIQTIVSRKANIETNQWILKDVKIVDKEKTSSEETVLFYSNFNSEKISKLFSDLSSLTYFELKELKNNYQKLGYTTIEVDSYLNTLYRYVFYSTLMTIFASCIMLYIKRSRSKIFYIILGIFISVIIYYINYITDTLGQNLNLSPIIVSLTPITLLTLISLTQLISINEK